MYNPIECLQDSILNWPRFIQLLSMKSRFHPITILILLGVCLTFACQQNDGAFGPVEPTPTLIGLINQQSVPVNFETLNSDPSIFVDRFIQVSGRYIPLREASCARSRGPSVDWFLISDGLEMNMSGHGSIINILPNQEFVTVEGIWRRYEGPVGCAKEPQNEVVWHLEIVRILDPNPIIASRGGQTNNILVAPPASTGTPTDDTSGSDSPAPEDTPTPNIGNGQSTVPTRASTPTPDQTNETRPTMTPTATSTQAASPPTATFTPTATATQAREDGAETPTPTVSGEEQPTEEPTPTSDGLGGTGSGTPDPATPGPGYPGPGTPYP